MSPAAIGTKSIRGRGEIPLAEEEGVRRWHTLAFKLHLCGLAVERVGGGGVEVDVCAGVGGPGGRQLLGGGDEPVAEGDVREVRGGRDKGSNVRLEGCCKVGGNRGAGGD
jgi:hypothetical protein